MSIQIRKIANDDLLSLPPQLSGLHIQTDSTDLKGRLVSGNFQDAKLLDNGLIAITLTRYLNGQHVPDSVTVPAGLDPLGRPWRTAVHVREGSEIFETLMAA